MPTRFGMKSAALLLALALTGTGSAALAQGWYGPGMMGPGYGYGPGMMQGYGPGMMYGPGYGYGPGMMGGYGPGMMGGYGPGMMRGYGPGYGPGMMGGYGPGLRGGYAPDASQSKPLTVEDVKTELNRWLALRGNSRLQVGEVKEKDGDTIEADIVTKDKSLVQRFIVDRRSGFYRPDGG